MSNSEPVTKQHSAFNEASNVEQGASQPSEPRFEEAISELEQIVQNLNQPNIDLDEAINLYERGVRLAQRGRHLITHAESRVNQLREILTQPEGGGGNAPRSEGRN